MLVMFGQLGLAGAGGDKINYCVSPQLEVESHLIINFGAALPGASPLILLSNDLPPTQVEEMMQTFCFCFIP